VAQGVYGPLSGIFYFRLEKEQKAAAPEPTKKSRAIVLAAILATLGTCRQRAGFGAEVKMSTEHFEPYGEVLPEFRPGRRKPPTASAVLSAVGQYSFWLLVVVIVLARIAYFSPAPAFPTNAVPALAESAGR
jgi:hypothetical protein